MGPDWSGGRRFVEQALEAGLKSEVTVAPLVNCVFRWDYVDVSNEVDHEAFSRVTLMKVKHAASSRITRLRRRY